MKIGSLFGRKGIFLLVCLVFVMVSIANVMAITGSIGNARMILRVDQGDVIEKYVLVRNINDVSVDVELFASGELEKYIEIRDEKFILGPGDEKKAHFTIEAGKAGTTESKVNVQFAPSDGGNGVGLSSTVIVIAEEQAGFFDRFFDDEDPSEEIVDEDTILDDDTGVDVSVGGNGDVGKDDSDKKSNNKLKNIAIGSTLMLFIMLVLLIYISNDINKKKLKKDEIKHKKNDNKK